MIEANVIEAKHKLRNALSSLQKRKIIGCWPSQRYSSLTLTAQCTRRAHWKALESQSCENVSLSQFHAAVNLGDCHAEFHHRSSKTYASTLTGSNSNEIQRNRPPLEYETQFREILPALLSAGC